MAARKKAAARKKPTTRKKAAAKKPVGRPSKRSERTDQTIRAALSRGLSIETACAFASVSVESLRRWRKADPALESSIHQAIAAGRVQMAGKLWDQAQSGNVLAQQYWLTRRCPEFRQPKEQPVSLSGLGDSSDPRELAAAGIATLQQLAADKHPPAVMRSAIEAIEKLASLHERGVTREEFEELRSAAERAGIA